MKETAFGPVGVAISVHQPWAWLITMGIKDIENRTWSTKFRGRVLIHASKCLRPSEFAYIAKELHRVAPGVEMPAFKDLARGGIVGAVDIVDCVQYSKSPWFMGPHGFVLKNAEVLPFEAMRGQLNFFNPYRPAAESQQAKIRQPDSGRMGCGASSLI